MLDHEAARFVKVFLLIVGGLLPIVNPVGSSPIFLALTNGADRPVRNALAFTVALNSFVLLMGSLIFGHFVLRVFGLSIPVVQFAGGIVLCVLGARMLSDDEPATPEAPTTDGRRVAARAFYPLTLPLTVDPGAIAIAVAIGANHPHEALPMIVALSGGAAGVAAIAACVWLCYRYAEHVSQWIGHSRMMAVMRLSAFVVLCIGVEIAWNGAKALLQDVTFRTAPALVGGG